MTPEYLQRATMRMEKIDSLAPDVRELVHEFGWTVVNAFLTHGVTKARIIRHLIMMVVDGAQSETAGRGFVKARAATAGLMCGNSPNQDARIDGIRAFCASAGVKSPI